MNITLLADTSGSVRIDFNIQTKWNKYCINLLNNFYSIIKSCKRFRLFSMNKKMFLIKIFIKKIAQLHFNSDIVSQIA